MGIKSLAALGPPSWHLCDRPSVVGEGTCLCLLLLLWKVVGASLSPDPTEPQLGWLGLYLFVPSLPLLLNGDALGGVRNSPGDGDAHLWLRAEPTPDFRDARRASVPPSMSCTFPAEMGDRAQSPAECAV